MVDEERKFKYTGGAPVFTAHRADWETDSLASGFNSLD